MRKLFNRDKLKLAEVTPYPISANSSEVIPSSLDAHHLTTPSDDEHWHVLPSDPNNNSDMTKPLPSAPSRPLPASLPPGASPPLPNLPVNIKAYLGTPPIPASHNKDTEWDHTAPTLGKRDNHRRDVQDGQDLMRMIGIYLWSPVTTLLFLILSTKAT